MSPHSLTSIPSNARYVLVRLAGRLFGLPVDTVSEMLIIPDLTTPPLSAEFLRGVFFHRRQSVAVLDLRILMGIESMAQEDAEFRQMLTDREQDHRNWITELETSVEENRKFTLATDPHKCAFGRWYDTYRTGNVLLQTHLAKFDVPHKRIHAVAAEVSDLVDAGRVEQAVARIGQTRDVELREMVVLFQQFNELLDSTRREIVVILHLEGDEQVAYCVDRVEGVQELEPIGVDENDSVGIPASLRQSGLVPAFYGKKREVVLLFDEQRLPGLETIQSVLGTAS